MGLWSRITAIFGAKANRALDKLENPAETLDYSYEKQRTLLTNVKKGLAEVATSKQRLKIQVDKLEQQDAKLQSQAQQALVQNREDLARMALQRRQAIAPQLQSLNNQIADLDAQQAKLTEASRTLEARVEMFRTQKETLKAQYQASNAQVKINESFTGLSSEMNNLGSAVQRTQDRIEQMQARATALDELAGSGVLTQIGPGGDDIDRQLAQLTSGSDVDTELAAMKQAIAGPAQPLQLPGGAPAAGQQPTPTTYDAQTGTHIPEQ